MNNDNGACGATVTYSVTFADNCTGASMNQTAGQASGTLFPIGATLNTFVVTDGSSNTATCSFTVTVTDAELPVITCPSDITQDTDANSCDAVVNFTAPTGTDNCPGATTVLGAGGLASGSTFPLGATTNTYTVTDASGNEASCTFTVTIEDNDCLLYTSDAADEE